MRNAGKGFSPLSIIAVLALVAVAFVAYRALTGASEENVGMGIEDENRVAQSEMAKNDAEMEGAEHEQGAAQTSPSPERFTGAVIASGASALLEFNDSDFERALGEGRLVALYFYANWCPICRAEFPDAQQAFREYAGDGVVGFRVHFNDDKTTERDRELAREYGVAYQHTKVFLRGSERVLKSPETWSKAKYLETFELLTTDR